METKKLSFKPITKGEKNYIFASYSHKDSDAVTDIEKLHELGFRIWYDARIPGSALWEKKLKNAIKDCSQFLVFMSKKSANSTWVEKEIKLAGEGRKPIMPVFLDKESVGISSNFWNRRQGIERFKWVKDDNPERYYVKLIAELPKKLRKCDEDRDTEALGMCKIPGINNIVNGEPFDPELDRQVLVGKTCEEVHKKGCAVYAIETVFQLTSEETGAVENIGKLYLSKPSAKKPSHLLTHPLDIGTAYMAPLRLVTGLITRLDQNWPPLVASYRKLVSGEAKNRLEDLHYFIEFCWLAWGPSVLTTALLKDNSSRFMVTQAAFGDEANSLPLIMKKEKWRLIVSEFKKQHDNQVHEEEFKYRKERGWPVRLKNVLIVKPKVDPYFKGLCDHELFKKMFNKKEEEDGSEPDKVALYLPYGDEGYDPGTAKLNVKKLEAFYSTAYVWLMIEPVSDSSGELTPGHVIPFFEHANLATSKGLQFLQHCLARKAIYHAIECEKDPDYREKGVYRFATALFPDQMVEILEIEKKRLSLQDRKTVERRLRISHDPKTWRSPSEVVRFADALSDRIMNVLKTH